MSDERQRDSDLRAHFAALKRADAGRAPSFERVMARAKSDALGAGATIARPAWRTTARRYGWLGGLAAAATIVALISIPRSESDDAAFERAVKAFHSDSTLGAWHSPTDGLLDLPGNKLIATTPSVSSIR